MTAIEKHNVGRYLGGLVYCPSLVNFWIKCWVSVYDFAFQKGDEYGRIERPGGVQIWGLSWVPSTEADKDMICVADWGQTLSFYNTMGKQVCI